MLYSDLVSAEASGYEILPAPIITTFLFNYINPHIQLQRDNQQPLLYHR
jgi:hypothetical protein